MEWKYVLWAFLGYLLYRFIFGFVVPVYKATRQVKAQMKQFQQRMNEHQEQHNTSAGQQSNTGLAPDAAAAKPAQKDYIEFEEL
jgi:predicted phage tail protein